MELPMAYFVRNRKSLSLGRLIDVYTEYAPITCAYDPSVTTTQFFVLNFKPAMPGDDFDIDLVRGCYP